MARRVPSIAKSCGNQVLPGFGHAAKGQIASFAGIEKLVNLQVLYASNNKIDKWPEVERLQSLPKMRELNLVNNPLLSTTAL